MTAPPEAPVEWTPWVTFVCARPQCAEQVTREWAPAQPPPKYCGQVCARKDSRRRSRLRARQEGREGLESIVTVTVEQCARPGCDRSGERQWHTASGDQPVHCSAWCARIHGKERNQQRKRKRDVAGREHPEKRAYTPTPGGTRAAAIDAVKFEKYVYSCRCLRFHLTTDPVPGAPVIGVDHKRSRAERTAAWHEYLLPIAQRLREKRSLRAARERS